MKTFFKYLLTALAAISSLYGYSATYSGCFITQSEAKVYLIGDFNNWELPKLIDGHIYNKGALEFYEVGYRFSKSYNEEPDVQDYTQALEMFPKGDTRFVIYVFDGVDKGFYHDESLTEIMENNGRPTPIYLNRDPDKINIESYRITHPTKERSSLDKEKAFELKNWNGGIIKFNLSKSQNNRICEINSFSSNASFVKSPDKLYSTYEIDGKGQNFVECENVRTLPGYISSSYSLPTLSGESFVFSFTENPDSNDSDNNMYGALYPDPVIIKEDMDFHIPIIKGGYPIDIRLDSYADLSVTIHPVSNIISCSVSDMPTEIKSVQTDSSFIRFEDNKIKLDDTAEIQIYDIVGNLILNCFDSSVDLSSTPSGVYIVKSGTNTLKIKI